MAKHLIGILTAKRGNLFPEQSYFRRLIQEGEALGVTVFLFTPDDVSIKRKRIDGFVPTGERGWKRDRFSWPDIVIDRYRYYPIPEHEGYLSFRKKNLFEYVNNRFTNKWALHQLFAQDEEMKFWLPESVEYSHAHMEEMFSSYPMLYLKPTNGTGGRGILRIEKRENGYALLGSDKDRVKKNTAVRSIESLYQWTDNWVEQQRRGKENFFVQQGLELDLIPDRTVDLRMLIQKNEEGDWEITGMGVRIGQQQSSTSNLHTGGKAKRASQFLSDYFGKETAQTILEECRTLAHRTVEKIEFHFGQMMEFGLDIGVDAEGKVWLIEINPKPGREILRQLGQMDRYRESVRRPIQYAMYVLKLKKVEKDLLQ